jgi:MFS family permease
VPVILAQKRFVEATVTNFFFIGSLNGFVLLPLLIQREGGTEVEIGIVMGLYSAVGIVGQPLVGPLTDAMGRRPFMVAGVLLVLVAALLAALAPTLGVLALVRVLQGLGFSAFFVASYSYVIDLVPAGQRGWALGLYGVAGLVATAVAPVAGEAIIRRWGFRPLFLLAAALAAAALGVVWRLRGGHAGGAVAAPAPAPFLARVGLGEVLQRSMAVTLFFGLGAGTVWVFLPTFAEDLGVRTLGLFFTAYAVAAVAVRLLGGRLIDTHGRRAVIVPSMFVQAGATMLLAAVGFLITRTSATPVVPVLFLAGLMSGAAHGFLYPGLAALVTDRTPAARRGVVVGLFSAVFLVGQTAGAFVFGYVTHLVGYAPMWAALAGLLVIGAALSVDLEEAGGA